MSYHVVTVFNFPGSSREELVSLAIESFGSSGVEEYVLDEPAVDEILGERSYSGGDLPLEVLREVDELMAQAGLHFKFFFNEEGHASRAEAFLQWLRQQHLCEAQLEEFAEQDWNREWKKHYHPIVVSDELVILPQWYEGREHTQKSQLRINPGMGFGTGSHETTFLCLKHFTQLRSQLPSEGVVLDYGSGSGILGLAALGLMPRWQAVMVDIDPLAHENGRQNAQLNSISEHRLSWCLLDKRPTTSFALVFANILQGILHEESEYLTARLREGGLLILSGLLSQQLPVTQAWYLRSRELELVSREVRGDWGCLVLRRRS